MQVIYSIGAKFAGGGIGTTAYHAVRGLHRHGVLQRLLCGSFRPTEIPKEKIQALGLPSRALRKLAVYDRSRRIQYMHSILFDIWASRHVEQGNVFHVWGNYGLRSMQQAKAVGMVTIVECASSHPVYRTRLLLEEYAHWGLTFRIPQAALQRSLAEIETADYVLVPSDFVRHSFLKHGVSEGKLIQIPFGVDIRHFRPTGRPKSGNPFQVLFVGQVSLQKGVLYLLEAWKVLCWRDAELWIVGRIDPEVRLLSQRYTCETIHMVGYAADPVRFYQQADVFAFPSIQEGSALVTYEALASGLPVITTPNAGSVVRDGVEGFIVPIRDVEALVTAMEHLRTDERLRCEMGRAARLRAESFSWDHYGDALVEAYQQRVLA